MSEDMQGEDEGPYMPLSSLVAQLDAEEMPPRMMDWEDDEQVAQAFLHRFNVPARPIRSAGGGIYRYDPPSGVWRELRQDMELLDLFRKMSGDPIFFRLNKKGEVETRRWRMQIEKAKRAAMCVRSAVHQPALESAEPGVAFENCYLTVGAEGKLESKPHSPDNYCRWAVPFSYSRTAQAPAWLELLHRIFEGDPDEDEKIDVLHEFLGASLFGLTPRYEKALVLYGEGANGKSSITDAVLKLFTDLTCSVAPQTWEHEYYRARLDGPLLNVVSEMPDRELASSDLFKKIISGEKNDGRFPHGRAFEFKPRCGHIFAVNELPSTNDFSEGYWRRFLIMTFPNRFGGQTREQVIAPVLEELAGIATLAVAGAGRLLRTGSFTKLSTQDEMRKSWQLESDQVAAFVEECCTRAEGYEAGFSPADDVYRAYRTWAEKSGHRAVAKPHLGRRLRKLGVLARRKADGAHWGVVTGFRRQESHEQPHDHDGE